MLRYIKLLCVLLLTVLTGCSYIYGGDNSFIQNRDTDYLKAKSIPPLRIPPGLSSSTIQAHYPVSDQYYPNSTQKINLTPPELDMTTPAKPVQKPVAPPSASLHPSGVKELATPNYYYDPHTRSSATSSAGNTIGSVFKSLWPKSMKNTSPPSTNVVVSNDPKKNPQKLVAQNKDLVPDEPKDPNEEKRQIDRHYFDRFSHR